MQFLISYYTKSPIMLQEKCGEHIGIHTVSFRCMGPWAIAHHLRLFRSLLTYEAHLLFFFFFFPHRYSILHNYVYYASRVKTTVLYFDHSVQFIFLSRIILSLPFSQRYRIHSLHSKKWRKEFCSTLLRESSRKQAT